MIFDGLGKKVRPGSFGKIKQASGSTQKVPLSKNMKFAVTPLVLTQIAPLFTLLDLCVASLRRGHANLLCIVPILTDNPRRESRPHLSLSEHRQRHRRQRGHRRRHPRLVVVVVVVLLLLLQIIIIIIIIIMLITNSYNHIITNTITITGQR